MRREARAVLPLVGEALAILAAFALLERMIVGLGRLHPSAYEQAFFSPQLATRSVGLLMSRVPVWAIAGFIALMVLALIVDASHNSSAGRRSLARIFGSWRNVEHGTALRWLIAAATGVTMLALAAYPYNAYFDRSHLADRLLLAACWGALIWRPVFALPFALIASAIAGQFQVPLQSYSWTEMELLVRIPILLGTFWIVRSLARDQRIDVFVFLLACLIAVTWWSSGWGKLRVGWITHPHIDLLLVGAHANGWLGFMESERIVRIAHAIAAVRIPLMLATLVVECGALFVLWRRWSLPAFLVLTSTFHLGAFALTGIFFWKWILIDAAFLTFLLQGRRVAHLRIFSPAHFALAVVLVLGSRVWVAARNLTWFDTPLTYVISVEGVDADGGVHVLPAGFFRPYTETFVLETFPYLSPHVQLTGPMGVTQRRGIADALLAARTASDVFALERSLGASRFDPDRSVRFDEFVARWLRATNGAGARASLALPRHLWTFPLDTDWDGAPAILMARVVESTRFYDGTAVREIRRRTLRWIDVRTGIGSGTVRDSVIQTTFHRFNGR
jgi:hypothetical protein